MEPTEAINLFEISARRLVRDEWGIDWLAKGGLREEDLQRKLDNERLNRRGVVVSSDLLDYAEFSQLCNIIRDNWSVFAKAFQGQKYMSTYIGRLMSLRNGPMHSRDLLPFEREQLSGIVGEVANMLAAYRSEKGPDLNHYPVIEQISDSFGNIDQGRNGQAITQFRLEVGQRVEFTCRGTDPQNRDLSWSGMSLVSYQHGGEFGLATGSPTTLVWNVEEKHVSENVVVLIKLKSSGRFHRAGDHDDQRQFVYAINPPPE